MQHIEWDLRNTPDGTEVFKGVISIPVPSLVMAQFLVNQLNEGDMHRSMCRRAAAELGEHWEAHCDGEGYGPVNLMNRLSGEMPPDYYPGYID